MRPPPDDPEIAADWGRPELACAHQAVRVLARQRFRERPLVDGYRMEVGRLA